MKATNSSRVGVFLALGIPFFLSSCGGPGTSAGASANSLSSAPSLSGSTNVVVLLTSTANDRLVSFDLAITSVALTDNTGKSVTLFSRPFVQNGASGFTEFMHLNGASEPLVTTSIPQGVYVSATVRVAACQFNMVTVGASGGLLEATDAEGLCGQGTGNTTVNLPSSITVTSSAMALSFDLQVPQSYALTGSGEAPTYTISPVFTLTPITLATPPTNAQNGKVIGIDAQITDVGAASNSFGAQMADGISLTVNSSGETVYQGIVGLSFLAAGMVVDMDIAIQSDGSLVATRVEVDDSAANAAVTGLLLTPTSQATVVGSDALDCFLPIGSVPVCDSLLQFDSNSFFQVSGQLSNLPNLPFTPLFNSSHLILGQNVTAWNTQGVAVARGLTLAPQTINGSIGVVSQTGGFVAYTVAIAAYDLIPVTQQQVLGTFPALTNPTSVVVYADANTELEQSGLIGPGSVLRFRGVIFDDNGTLRMDCAAILDGVPD